MVDEPVASAPLAADEWLARARALERRGEFLRAYDLASQALREYPDHVGLRYRAVLALARAGATRIAEQRYVEYGLGALGGEDIGALSARLAKDAALAETGERRAARARLAADRYEDVYTRTFGYFSAINAATMRLVSGAHDRAKSLARQVLHDLETTQNAGGDDDAYYRLATRAEAHLILNDARAARESLAAALGMLDGDLAALATTRKQLRLVCQMTGIDDAVLDGFVAPTVIYFCGHMIEASGRFGQLPAMAERAMTDAIRRHLEQQHVGFGYGCLGAGADIVIAEALIERDAELHVVLPFRRDEFVDVSVRRGGPEWVRRFERCVDAAATVRFATEDSFLGDEQLFGYASGLAMGLTILRARYLDAPVEQVAVWNGVEATRPWGTAADVASWRRLGLPQHIFGSERRPQAAPAGPSLAPAHGEGRVQRAMLFGDVKGFSRLGDRELPVFVREVLGTLAHVVEGFGAHVSFKNTWGDGLFLVFDEPRDAARCALALQRAMVSIPLDRHGLPAHLALRLGGHFGPVYRARDPILDVENYFGAHVSRAARIEPVTPEGAVYLTEPFAAMLALDPTREFECDYVGHQAAAKHYGDLPMYLLRARRPTADRTDGTEGAVSRGTA